MTASYASLARPRSYRPLRRVGFWLVFVAFTGMAAAIAVVGVIEYSHGSRSQTVQHHGIRATGHVDDVSVQQTGGANNRGVRTTIAVTLTPPVRGADATTVHVEGSSTLTVGSTATVLVDPDDTAYAELPGHPTGDLSTWWAAAGVSVAMLAIVVRLLVSAVRMSRRPPAVVTVLPKHDLHNHPKRLPQAS